MGGYTFFAQVNPLFRGYTFRAFFDVLWSLCTEYFFENCATFRQNHCSSVFIWLEYQYEFCQMLFLCTLLLSQRKIFCCSKRRDNTANLNMTRTRNWRKTYKNLCEKKTFVRKKNNISTRRTIYNVKYSYKCIRKYKRNKVKKQRLNNIEKMK